MRKFSLLNGLVVPLDRANVDTDAIIPKQFLKSIKRSGFGPNAFDEWRYLDHGEPGMDNSQRPLNKDFVLNQPRYAGASVLLARRALHPGDPWSGHVGLPGGRSSSGEPACASGLPEPTSLGKRPKRLGFCAK